jgi:MinD superfamily P-loop ATPase
MKELVIISGKGGTGKTSVAAALAFIEPENLVLADCDVDAADMHLILKPVVQSTEDFISGVKAEIDPATCISCDACKQICRFSAIRQEDNVYHVDPLDCEGCGYCYHVCPVQAITMPLQNVGQCYVSATKIGCQLVHAKLCIGADNSGKLVAKVKKDAKAAAISTHKDYILVDGSPGIGCPVISSLSGADFVLLITEPTLSGMNDLKRVWELITKFRIPAGCIINKANINPSVAGQIAEYLASQGIWHVLDLPYDEDFSRAITLGQSLVEYNPSKWKPIFGTIWKQLTKETK